MGKTLALTVVAAIAAGSAAWTALANQRSAASPAAEQPKICKMVVDHKPRSKPYQLCMTGAEWEAKKVADAKDATRIECRYEEMSGTRFRSAKVCMTAAEWWNQRQADRQAVERIQMQTCVQGAGC